MARYLTKEEPLEIVTEARTERVENIMAKNPFEGISIKTLKQTKNRKIDDVPHDYTLYPKYMALIKANYPKNEMTFLRHIAAFRQYNFKTLSTIYPLDYPVYGQKDMMIIYEATGIDKDEITADVKNVKIPTVNFEVTEKKNFRPDLVVLIMIYEYYLVEMQAKEMAKGDLILSYIGYAMYWSVYNKFFQYKPNEDQIRYSIDTANNKFILRDPQINSIDNLIRYCVGGPIINNVSLLYDPFDLSFSYIIDAIKTSLTGKIKSIFNKIQEDSKKANNRTFVSTDDPETYGEARSTSLDVQALAMKYTTKFLSSNTIDPDCITYAAATCTDVSEKALKVTIQHVLDSCPQNEVQEIFECIFTIYINDPDVRDPDLQNKKKFISCMLKTFKKGHTNNKNDNLIKDIINKWLFTTNPSFANTNRRSTLTNYRKAVFMYFTMYIVR